MSTIAGRRVMVTGGAGFLGQAVCRELEDCRPAEIFVPRSAQYDLRDRAAIQHLLQDARPHVVIHLAAVVGGIGANRDNPGSYFYDNAIMGIELMEQSRRAKVEKFLVVGSICSYPKHTPVPFREDDIWSGYPEETNAPYGLAKKTLLVQAQAYRQQYGFNAVTLLPVNLYGPGDNFDLGTSHVIPALIRKIYEAKRDRQHAIDVWGTGTVSREFLFVRDAAQAIVLATGSYNKPDPVNVGTGHEITIRDLVRMICDMSGYQGQVHWKTELPDGQPRRCLDISRARIEFGFNAKTSLRDGIQETIDWYAEHSARIAGAAA